MKTLQITLPDGLASQADRAGLLDPDKMEAMLRKSLREKAAASWKVIQEAQDADPVPPMTADEIQEEINAYRAEKRLAAGA